MKASTAMIYAGSTILVFVLMGKKKTEAEAAIDAQQRYYEQQIRQGNIPGAKP